MRDIVHFYRNFRCFTIAAILAAGKAGKRVFCFVCEAAYVEGEKISEETFYCCSMCRNNEPEFAEAQGFEPRSFPDDSPEINDRENDRGNA